MEPIPKPISPVTPPSVRSAARRQLAAHTGGTTLRHAERLVQQLRHAGWEDARILAEFPLRPVRAAVSEAPTSRSHRRREQRWARPLVQIDRPFSLPEVPADAPPPLPRHPRLRRVTRRLLGIGAGLGVAAVTGVGMALATPGLPLLTLGSALLAGGLAGQAVAQRATPDTE